MTSPAHDPEQRWSRLITRARADVPPSLDVAALLTRLDEAQAGSATTWLADLGALLETPRCFATCAIGAVTMATAAVWQVVMWVEALEWVGWIYPAAGGVL